MDIYLVRHGEAAASWEQSSDPGLSELGVRQAGQTCKRLQRCLGADTQLVSSPLARACETAAPLAAVLHKPVRIDDAFREIPSPVPLAQRKTWLRQFMTQAWDTQPEGLHEWRARGLTKLLEQRSSTVVFTHFLFINAIVGQVLGRAETLCFWPANASVTRLRHTGKSLELLELGREMETVVN